MQTCISNHRYKPIYQLMLLSNQTDIKLDFDRKLKFVNVNLVIVCVATATLHLVIIVCGLILFVAEKLRSTLLTIKTIATRLLHSDYGY